MWYPHLQRNGGEKIVYKYSGGQDDIAAIRIKKAKKSYSINSLTTNSCANYTWKFIGPCKVLIFNGTRVLVAIVRSLHSVAELTHENKSAIHNCCTGKSVRSGAYYYRHLHPDILLEIDDLDKLTLKEYDDLCGVKRKYISTRKMARIRQKVRVR